MFTEKLVQNLLWKWKLSECLYTKGHGMQ